jgi:hypothetical protein
MPGNSRVNSTAGKVAKQVRLGKVVRVVDPARTTEPTRKKRELGTLKGKIKIIDPDWWKPQSDD